MLRKVDRIAIVLVSLAVGLQAIIPGWGLMADGSVYGFKMPLEWLTPAWPFADYFWAGFILLAVVGLGGILTAAVNVVSPRAGAVTALVMGLVLIGWIAGELIFLSQTMVMTWMILAAGFVLVALAAPYALPAIGAAVHDNRSPQAT